MKKYLVKHNDKIYLKDFDPQDNSEFNLNKEEGEKHILKLNEQLEELQELLFAEHKKKFLVVLQAMDTGGKDGVIRRVFEGVNPQGVRVASFKVPTSLELDHDYLWRIHQQVPGKGELVIFNRSHYEDVLAVRVHKLVPQDVWEKRFEHINNFEEMLTDEGTTILKFFLHIGLDKQKERLIARIDDQTKRWKFNPGDLKERELWANYQEAYEDVLSKTSTDWAPWYIIPANRKWYRDIVIATILIDKLKSLDMKYPNPVENIEQFKRQLQDKH